MARNGVTRKVIHLILFTYFPFRLKTEKSSIRCEIIDHISQIYWNFYRVEEVLHNIKCFFMQNILKKRLFSSAYGNLKRIYEYNKSYTSSMKIVCLGKCVVCLKNSSKSRSFMHQSVCYSDSNEFLILT